jgi:hypothetical protein
MSRNGIIATLLLTIVMSMPALGQMYLDCQPLYYYDKLGQDYSFSAAIPSTWFAVKMSPARAGRVDSAYIGFGIQKSANTRFKSDTVIIKILEDQLPNKIELGSYVFSFPPDLQGLVSDSYWIIELTFSSVGTQINPPRDFWFSWMFSGPTSDRANVHLKSAPTSNNRSVVITGANTVIPISTYAWNQVHDTVDLKVETRICYDTITPVEMQTFVASYVDGKTHLRWNTATETNNFGFDVERLDRRSDDGMISLWRKLGFVPGNGSTTEMSSYSFVDDYPEVAMDNNGVVRYRLRQRDYDGTENVSPVQTITIPTSAVSMMLYQSYPNPISATTTLASIPFSILEQQHLRVAIHDALGKLVATVVEGEYQAGYHSVSFSPQGFVPGWYSYSLEVGDRILTKRFLVNK